MEYILFVAYDSDAERKRIDYLLDKWSERATVRKPKGLVFYMDIENPQEFLEELFSKLEGNAKEKVEVYRVKKVEKTVETRRRVLEYSINEEQKFVEKFVDYLLSKMNAGYLRNEGDTRVYSVYTRKGSATIQVTFEGSSATRVVFDIEGYGDSVDFIAERIDEELRLFAGG